MIANKYFNTSNWTGRTLRTMQDAFGCGSHWFEKPAPNMGNFKSFIFYILFVVIAMFMVSLISGVIKLW